MKGLIHIYCGDGKGKTTCATGLAIRAAGNNMKVLMIRFLKNDNSSELSILNTIELITVIPCEKEFGFFFQMTEEQKTEAQKVYSSLLHSAIEQVKNQSFQLLIMDEVMAALKYNLIEESELLSFLEQKPNDLEVVLTGRDPSEKLLSIADYVSEIKKIKHPFDQGIQARKGIEF